MKLTKLFLVLASFGALMVASDSMVLAGPPNAGFTVKASVISGCSISAQATMDFGNYNPLSTTDLSSTGSVSIICTKGASVSIGLTNGANFASSTNNMKISGSGTDLLAYKLYQPDGSTQWSDSEKLDGSIAGLGSILSVTGSGTTATPYSITGKLVAGQNVPVGSYSDTVYALVNF